MRKMKLNKRGIRLLKSVIICLTILLVLIIIVWYSLLKNNVSSIELKFDNEEKMILNENDEKKLNVFVTSNYTEKLKYSVEDNKVATINESGYIKALKAGTTKVIVKLEGTKREIFKELIVNKAINPESIVFKNIKKQMVIGESIPLEIEIMPTNASYKSIAYKSSNDAILSVTPEGTVMAVGAGKGKITATIDGIQIEESSEITVYKQYDKLRFLSFKEGKSGHVESGDKMQLHVKMVPDNIKNNDVKFSSNNVSIASVDADGVIQTHRPGEVTIIATSQENQKICVKYELQVRKTTGYLTNELLNKVGASGADKLMVVAHPDDDILWGGAHLSEGGWFVVCLTNEYNDKRNAEFNHAMDVVNAKRIILSYPDLVNHKRNNWNSCKTSIQKDMDLLMNYKKWSQIVTHNPDGEYGHIHHKMTSKFMTQSSHKNATFSSLSYFGHFYSKPSSSLKKINAHELNEKEKALNCYTTQLGAIERNWKQMVPYENWIKASEW